MTGPDNEINPVYLLRHHGIGGADVRHSTLRGTTCDDIA